VPLSGSADIGRRSDGDVVSAHRDCAAPIFWANSKNGKSMPMDAEPTSQGRYVLDDKGVDQNPVAVFANPLLLPEEHHYDCHFNTCPTRRKER
jgi:hypothetical protein